MHLITNRAFGHQPKLAISVLERYYLKTLKENNHKRMILILKHDMQLSISKQCHIIGPHVNHRTLLTIIKVIHLDLFYLLSLLQ